AAIVPQVISKPTSERIVNAAKPLATLLGALGKTQIEQSTYCSTPPTRYATTDAGAGGQPQISTSNTRTPMSSSAARPDAASARGTCAKMLSTGSANHLFNCCANACIALSLFRTGRPASIGHNCTGQAPGVRIQ